MEQLKRFTTYGNVGASSMPGITMNKHESYLVLVGIIDPIIQDMGL